MKWELTLDQFDIKGFFETAAQDGKEFMDPSVFVIKDLNEEQHGDWPEQTFERLIDALSQEGLGVYVTFSNLAMECDVRCVDGNTYYYVTQERYDREKRFAMEPIQFPEDVRPTQNLWLGDRDTVGYLVTYKRGLFTIQTGIGYMLGKHYNGLCGAGGGDIEFEAWDDLEIFEEPAREYVQRFVQGSEEKYDASGHAV